MTLSFRLASRAEPKALLNALSAASGQNLLACLQCGKCTGSCPVAWAVPYGPRQTIEMIQLGLKEQVLSSELAWYCVGCTICASRCPVQIDFSRLATAIIEMAVREGRQPPTPEVHRWEELFLRSIQHGGRVHEVRAILELNLRSGRPWRDALMGLAMFTRGLIGPADLLARSAEGQPAVARIFANLHARRQEAGPPAELSAHTHHGEERHP